MSKSKTVIVTIKPSADEVEFYRRRNYAAVEVRIISEKSSQSIFLRHHQLGDIGSCTKIFKRGKVIATHYILPTVKGHRYGDTFVSITPGEVEE